MNARRTKKLLGPVFSDPKYTARQKVCLRKTYSVFDCLRMAKHFEVSK